MKLLYQCEICRSIYPLKEATEFCESTLLPEPEYKVGDLVEVQTRYDGWESDKIVSVSVEPDPYLPGVMLGWLKSNGVKGLEVFKGKLQESPRALCLHEHVYELEHEHMISKDSDSKFVDQDYLRPRAAEAA